jgi:hypothetical protein
MNGWYQMQAHARRAVLELLRKVPRGEDVLNICKFYNVGLSDLLSGRRELLAAFQTAFCVKEADGHVRQIRGLMRQVAERDRVIGELRAALHAVEHEPSEAGLAARATHADDCVRLSRELVERHRAIAELTMENRALEGQLAAMSRSHDGRGLVHRAPRPDEMERLVALCDRLIGRIAVTNRAMKKEISAKRAKRVNVPSELASLVAHQGSHSGTQAPQPSL